MAAFAFEARRLGSAGARLVYSLGKPLAKPKMPKATRASQAKTTRAAVNKQSDAGSAKGMTDEPAAKSSKASGTCSKHLAAEAAQVRLTRARAK